MPTAFSPHTLLRSRYPAKFLLPYPVGISTGLVVRGLLLLAGTLVLINVLDMYLLQHGYAQSFVVGSVYTLFSLNEEGNIATLFSCLLLATASGLLALAAVQARRLARRWWLLSGVFLFLALDEGARIHEFVSTVLQILFARYTTGWLHYAWVVPYSALTLALGIYLLPLLLSLPLRTRLLFVAAGFVYVGAALGMEMFEGYFDSVYKQATNTANWIYILEETLEMLGIILFIYALLRHLALYARPVALQFTHAPQPGPQAASTLRLPHPSQPDYHATH